MHEMSIHLFQVGVNPFYVLLAAAGIVLARRLYRLWVTRRWQYASGTLLVCSVQFADVPWYLSGVSQWSKLGFLYDVSVEYAYEVMGHRHTSTRLTLHNSNKLWNSPETERWIQSLSEGGRVAVYHDPAKPQRATLLRKFIH